MSAIFVKIVKRGHEMQKGANMGIKIAHLKLGGQNCTIKKLERPKLQFNQKNIIFVDKF
jgi:hypothetical protein